MAKAIPTGISSFREIRSGNYYYVDKTMMIHELLYPAPKKAVLITRPRRFGKSLNLSMLECFLDITKNGESIFDGLKIMEYHEICNAYMHRFPVIHVSFKDIQANTSKADGSSDASALNALKGTIGELAEQYTFLLQSERLSDDEKIAFRQISARNRDTGGTRFLMSEDALKNALKTLTDLLKKHYGQPAVILMDEYDVPLNDAFEKGYYPEFVNIYRSILSSALKDNDSLAFAVITGCLKISKESIFTGVNNFYVNDVTSRKMSDAFGFSDQEVKDMLDEYGLGRHHEQVRRFYDGYRFGSRLAYNPWSVMTFIDDNIGIEEAQPRFSCGWIGTSGNDILRKLLLKAEGDANVAYDIEALSHGTSITKRILEQLTFENMYSTADGIWTIMLHTGYLTCENLMEEGNMMLRIPNEEVLRSLDDLVSEIAVQQTEKGRFLRLFCEAVESFRPQEIERTLNLILDNSVSLRDTATKAVKENYYHGIMNAALLYRSDWIRTSNPETGSGYCDIMVENSAEDWGIVFELKYSGNADDFNAALDEATRQILTCQYARRLKKKRYHTIHLYAAAFHGTQCRVREVHEPV
ncbi:MAG: AAA family ATPase [Solobacterium sp.]|nr:AAA family ATPase [Solobacterium sp.]